MDCEDVRTYLLDEHRGQLAPELGREVRTHLERCAACAHEDAAERALGELLERRLPQHPAPRGLKRRLATQWSAPAAPPVLPWARWRYAAAPALAAALVLAVAAPLLAARLPRAARDPGAEALSAARWWTAGIRGSLPASRRSSRTDQGESAETSSTRVRRTLGPSAAGPSRRAITTRGRWRAVTRTRSASPGRTYDA